MKRTHISIAVAALVIFASLSLPAAPAAGQIDERTKQGTGLTTDSLEAILKDLRTYDTSDVGPAMRLRAYVFSHKDNAQARKETEAALLKFIQGSPAPGGLMAACRALRLVGGPDSVPVLAALALKPETTDAARYALERIPGEEADRALVEGLGKTAGAIKRGIVFSLGERKTAAAVPALTGLTAGKDGALAADAVKALGKIGGAEAVKTLTAMLGRPGATFKSEAASALLLATEGLLASGDKASAATVYDKVFAANISQVSRQAAFKGKLAAADDARAMILRTLTGKDALLFAPALAAVPANFGEGEISQVGDLMARLPEEAKIQLTSILAGYPADIVRPYLLSAAENPSGNVRLAALRSIVTAGDGKSVVFLATKAARSAGAEQDAAREALARLRGSDVDEAILAHLAKTSDDAVKAELVQAAGARRIAGSEPALMAIVKSGPPALKAKAAAALRTVAGEEDLPALLALLGALDDETAREAMQDTVAAAARMNPRETARSSAVKSRLADEKDAGKKGDLIRILGKIGDDSALPLVRTALSDPDAAVVDAAVRALADWPTIAARDDVLDIARTSIVLNHRILSIRAYIRMIGLEPNRSPEGAAADLLKVLSVSTRPEEKKLVLGLLGRFPCVTALKAAESLLADPTVAAEAKLAADRIRKALK